MKGQPSGTRGRFIKSGFRKKAMPRKGVNLQAMMRRAAKRGRQK